MYEFNNIKAELEQSKCPVHGISAKVTFAFGKMKVENYCCDFYKQSLDENLTVIAEENVADIIREVF